MYVNKTKKNDVLHQACLYLKLERNFCTCSLLKLRFKTSLTELTAIQHC